TVRTVVVERHDLNRDVARQRIVLELTEHGPAENVRQMDIEGNGCRVIFRGKRQRLGAALADNALEADLVRRIEKNAGVARIILNDKQDLVSGGDAIAVIIDTS